MKTFRLFKSAERKEGPFILEQPLKHQKRILYHSQNSLA